MNNTKQKLNIPPTDRVVTTNDTWSLLVTFLVILSGVATMGSLFFSFGLENIVAGVGLALIGILSGLLGHSLHTRGY